MASITSTKEILFHLPIHQGMEINFMVQIKE